MTGLRGRQAVFTIASVLVTGIADSLESTEGGPVERACVVPGEVAWDSCSCGLLAVTARRFYLSDDFPVDVIGTRAGGGARATPCDLPWLVAELAIQVIRCVPVPTEQQLTVSCDALTDAARVLLEDAYVTLTETVSTLCTLKDADQVLDYAVADQVTRGPEGDCVGTELAVFVAVDR